jgi:hypothetical protein
METIRIEIQKANNGFIVNTYNYFKGHNDLRDTYVFEDIETMFKFIQEELKNK